MLCRRSNPLIFRKDGSLDFGPLVWAVAFGVGTVLLVLDAFGFAKVSTAAWAYLGALTSITAIAGAAAERAYWISQSGTPGEVARGIAEAGPEVTGLPPIYRHFDDPDAD